MQERRNEPSSSLLLFLIFFFSRKTCDPLFKISIAHALMKLGLVSPREATLSVCIERSRVQLFGVQYESQFPGKLTPVMLSLITIKSRTKNLILGLSNNLNPGKN